MASPGRGTTIAKRLTKSEAHCTAYTPEEALALIVDLNLSKEQYLRLRTEAKSRDADMYPNYHRVRHVKASCMPPEGSIDISPTFAKVNLQSLLNHTVDRLLEVQKEVVALNWTRIGGNKYAGPLARLG